MSRVLLGLVSAVLVLAVSGCAGLAAGAEETRARDAGGKQAGRRHAHAGTHQATARASTICVGRTAASPCSSSAATTATASSARAPTPSSWPPSTPLSGQAWPWSACRATRSTCPSPQARPTAVASTRSSGSTSAPRARRKPALKKTSSDLAYAFGTEIDYYALVEFDGLDPAHQQHRRRGRHARRGRSSTPPCTSARTGLKLKAGQRQLDGKKALAFSRSRHTDSDYDRSRRQHQVLAAAAVKVRKRGQDQLAVAGGRGAQEGRHRHALRAAPALLELAAKADLDKVKSVVLEPGRYARQLTGSYTIAPQGARAAEAVRPHHEAGRS